MSKLINKLKKKVVVLASVMLVLQPLLGLAVLPASTYANVPAKVLAPSTTLVEWNFPNNPDDAIADDGIALNSAKTISTVDTDAVTFDMPGDTTKSAQTTGWDGGLGTKYWQVEFSSEGYNALTLSSKQRSSVDGPRDFKVQYKVGVGAWTDVASTTVTVANDYTGALLDIPLSVETEDQNSVFLRWIMTSDTAVNDSPVASSGASNIDDIVVQGTVLSSDATVTSGVYTVSAGGTSSETITNVPSGTSKATFLAALAKGQADQTWTDTAIADPVVTGNTLVVTAQDTTTIVTYTVTVNAPVVLSPVVETPIVTPVVATVVVPEPIVQNDQYGAESYQGEVKADTTVKADDGNNSEENKDEKKEDTKGKQNIPLWGIIFLLILAGIGGYLFYSQSPEKTNGKK